MSTVIRAGDVPRIASRLGAVDLNDHLAEARTVVVEARARAASILKDARSEASRLGAQSRQEGFDNGFAEGFEKAYRSGKQRGDTRGYDDAHAAATARFDEQHAVTVTDLNRIIDQMDAKREALHLSAKRDVIEFAIALATKLTYRIGALNQEAAKANLERALELTQSKTNLTIRAHPDDLAAIEEFAGSALEHGKRAGGLQFVSDESVDPGGCVVKNQNCEVDATLSVQLDEIVSLLLGEIDGRDAGLSGDSTDG